MKCRHDFKTLTPGFGIGSNSRVVYFNAVVQCKKCLRVFRIGDYQLEELTVEDDE